MQQIQASSSGWQILCHTVKIHQCSADTESVIKQPFKQIIKVQ